MTNWCHWQNSSLLMKAGLNRGVDLVAKMDSKALIETQDMIMNELVDQMMT